MSELLRTDFTEGVKKDMYGYSLEQYPQEASVHEMLFEQATSDSAYELDTNAIGMGKLKEKPEGTPIDFTSTTEGFTVAAKMKTFADGLEISMESAEDMNPRKMANMIINLAGTWTQKSIETKEDFYSNIFNYGGYTSGNEIFNASGSGYTDNSGDLVYDGKPFFNLTGNKRPLTPGGTAAYHNAVALGLTEANLKTLYDLMRITNAVDSRGDKVNIRPDTLLVHPSLVWTARTLMDTLGQVGTANNDNNSVRGLLEVVEWRNLDTSTFWAIGSKQKGIKAYNRKPLIFDFWQDPITGGFKASVIERYGVEVNDFRYWAASNAPTS